MRGFEQDNIKGIARLLKILIRHMHLSVEIFHFFRKISMLFLPSFTGINGLVEEINPVSDKLLFGLLLNRLKVEPLTRFPDRQDEVFSLPGHFSRLRVKVEELINSSLLPTDLEDEVVELHTVSLSLSQGISTLTMHEKKPSSSMKNLPLL